MNLKKRASTPHPESNRVRVLSFLCRAPCRGNLLSLLEMALVMMLVVTLAVVAPGPLVAQAAQDISAAGPDISGTYDFEREGESIQLNLDRGRLSGYISKLGDEVSDRGTPLTFFFEKGVAFFSENENVQRTHVTFSTKQLHGLWYSFEGDVVRGDGQRRDDAGYYVLQGMMTLHRVNRRQPETAQPRKVSFRSQSGNT